MGSQGPGRERGPHPGLEDTECGSEVATAGLTREGLPVPTGKKANRPGSSVWVFLALVFILSWPVILYGFGWFDSEEAVLKRYVLSCAGMLMVALSALLTRTLVERRGVRDAGWHLGYGRWYLVALLFCALLWLGPPLAAVPLGELEWNPDLTLDERLVVVLSLAGFSLIAGFGEEFGWRGYLLPRLLLARVPVRLALLAIGLVWGVWHCVVAVGPLLRALLEGAPDWPSMIGPVLVRCVQMTGASIALSFIYGAVWLRSRSIFVCAYLHGCWIGIRDAASHLVSYPPGFRLITLAAVLAAWVLAHRWLQGYERRLPAEQVT